MKRKATPPEANVLCAVPVSPAARCNIPFAPANLAEYVQRPCGECGEMLYVGPRGLAIVNAARASLWCPMCLVKAGRTDDLLAMQKLTDLEGS